MRLVNIRNLSKPPVSFRANVAMGSILGSVDQEDGQRTTWGWRVRYPVQQCALRR
jgi:hypothetical protein